MTAAIEQGDQGHGDLMGADMVEPADFRRAMSRFAAGVTVVTAYDADGNPYGMTATAFYSVSLDPPLLLICINRASRTHDYIAASSRFGVRMLSEDSTEISVRCAQPGAAKWLPSEWLNEAGAAQTPVLCSAIIHADCTIYERHEAGTHEVFIGRVQNLRFGPDTGPLVYYQGSYHQLEQLARPAQDTQFDRQGDSQ